MNQKEKTELKDVLLQDEKPSVYFEKLRQDGRLKTLYPDLFNLIGVEQNPEYHPEGDVFTHTMMVLDEAAKLRERANNPYALMLAALYHDTGKKKATKMDRGKLRSIGHENESERIINRFAKTIELSKEDRQKASNLVKNHMRPNMLAKAGSRMRATDKLFSETLDPDDLLLLAEADSKGRGGSGPYDTTRDFLHSRLAAYRERKRNHAGDD